MSAGFIDALRMAMGWLSRVLPVTPSGRKFTVPAESRTYTVPSESRTYTVPAPD